VGDVPEAAYVAALSALDGMNSTRLRRVLERLEPPEAWHAVRRRRLPPELVGVERPGAPARAVGAGRTRGGRGRGGTRPARTPASRAAGWARQAEGIDPSTLLEAHRRAGVGLALRGTAAYPPAFADDPRGPAIVFWRGELDALAGMRAGIVGTRDATRYGLDVARTMAAELAAAGVAVVSGLALGIDGAAHAGALAVEGAPPIAVVGGGLDRTYPKAHARLWAEVAARGVVLSEYPLGTPPAAWRFPERNRLIAALADVVVVVESHAVGGSMLTAMAADRRGRTVLAVPGPVTSPSSAGTNDLLFEGRGPARDAQDVLLALGVAPSPRRSATERRPSPTGPAATVLDVLPWQPTSVEQLVLASGLDPGEVVLALDELEDAGWLVRTGGWVERKGREQAGGGGSR
jgi:DNA processing protein